jgi:hypothetical protein
MVRIEAGGTFSAEQMAEIARANGYGEVTPRLVRAFASEGLLDGAIRLPLPSGKGQLPGRWSSAQLRLFLELLAIRKRQPEVQRAALCNWPVHLWLTGQNDQIPIRQIRKALKTWLDAVIDRPTAKASGTAAADATQRLSSTSAPRRAEADMRQALVGYQMRDVKPVQLLGPLRRAMDPEGTREPREFEGAAVTPEGYRDLLVAFPVLRAHYAEINDQAFSTGRDAYLYFARGESRMYDEAVMAACSDLAVLLFAGLVHERGHQIVDRWIRTDRQVLPSSTGPSRPTNR